jgi:hypothetical protein
MKVLHDPDLVFVCLKAPWLSAIQWMSKSLFDPSPQTFSPTTSRDSGVELVDEVSEEV